MAELFKLPFKAMSFGLEILTCLWHVLCVCVCVGMSVHISQMWTSGVLLLLCLIPLTQSLALNLELTVLPSKLAG